MNQRATCPHCRKPVSATELADNFRGYCDSCKPRYPRYPTEFQQPSEEELEIRRKEELLRTFPQYTTNVDGNHQTLGVVSGVAVMGANALRDLAAGLTDFFGGRSGQYQDVLKRGQDFALTEMCEDAVSRGADLVAGIKLDYETIGNMLMVCASGTALKHSTLASADPESSEIT